MRKIEFEDKVNIKEVVDITKQITADDLNEVKSAFNDNVDETTEALNNVVSSRLKESETIVKLPGKNLIGTSWIENELVRSDGSVSSNEDYHRTYKIRIKSSQLYVSNYLCRYACFFSENGEVIPVDSNAYSYKTSFVSPQDAVTAIFTYSKNYGNKIQLEENIKTLYEEPYVFLESDRDGKEVATKKVADPKVLSSINSMKKDQVVVVNDTPTDKFNLSSSITVTTASNRYGFGNKIVPTSNHTINILKLVPENKINDYNGYATIEIFNKTDEVILFSKNIPAIVWNSKYMEKITLSIGSDITLQSGKEYQIRYNIVDNPAQQVNYARVPKVNDEVPSRVMFSGSSWLDASGDYNTYMEVLYSTDYNTYDKLVLLSDQILDLEEIIASAGNNVELFVPDEICCAVDQTIEIYNDQIINAGNKRNFHIDYGCNIGKHMERKFTVTGEVVGNYPLTVKVRTNNLEDIITKTINIKIVDVSAMATPYKMLCIGASYTANKPWYDEWKNLVFGKTGNRDDIDFIGSIQGTWGKHEGRSGWTATRYLSEGIDEAANIEITVSGVVEEPAIKKAYKLPLIEGGTTTFEIEELDLSDGAGTILLTRTGDSGLVDVSGTITEVESGTAGDTTINFSARTYISVNPFWNNTIGQVDFINYQSVYNVPTPDGVQFLIGTNSLSGGQAAIDQANADLKQLIDYIIRDWGQIEIYICLIPFFANQNGIGKTYGAKNENKDDLDKNVFYMISTLYELLNSYSNVYFTPVAQTHDSAYNFGKVERDINPRNSNYKAYDPIEGVHPQYEGYMQFADAMFATWAKNR